MILFQPECETTRSCKGLKGNVKLLVAASVRNRTKEGPKNPSDNLPHGFQSFTYEGNHVRDIACCWDEV